MFAAVSDVVLIGLIGLVSVFITSMMAPMVMGWVKGRVERDAIADAAKQAEADRQHVKIEHAQEAEDRRAEKQQD